LIPIAIQDEKLIAKALSNPKKKKDKPTLIADNNPTPTEKTVFEEKTVAPSESKSKYPVITKRKKVTIGNYSLKMVSANGIPAFIAEKGQSPAKVADFLGMSAKKLMKINDLQLFDVLEEGKVYYIQPKKTKAAVKTHTVQTGETVWEIAHVYGITVDALRDKNQLSKKEEVKAGRVLLLRKKLGKNEKPTYQKVVPPKNTPKPFEPEPNEIIIGKKEVSVKKTPKEKPLKEKAKEEREYTRQKEEEIIKEDRNPTNNTPRFPRNAQIHVIKQNETVMTILQRYGLSIKQFKEWNPMDDYLSIPAGTALMVGYQDATLSSPTVEIAPNSSTVVDAQVVKMKVKNPNPSEIYHIVQKGDTLYSISRKYQVSVQAIQRNNRKLSNTISIGEKLLIQ